MTKNDKISDYITFPRTFENYKFYKPIIVIILTFIIMGILYAIISFISLQIFGIEFLKTSLGGYEALNNGPAVIFADLIIIMFIPALYIASKIVKDRPFSSYSSSRGGWNYRLYFKALIIPIILFVIYQCIDTAVNGAKGTYSLSIEFIIALLITIPLQCIAEEYIFRGLIMQTVGAWFKIPLLAIVIQAIIFTLFHGYNSIGLIEPLVTGIIYGFFTWKTNGIEISSAIHTANNFSVGLFVMLGLHASSSTLQLSSVAMTVAFYIVVSAIIYYVGNKTDWFGEIQQNA